MDKLLELEKRLKEAKEQLEKNASMGYGEAPAVNSGGSDPSMMKEDHKDEKQDKKMIAEAIDEHNEKKHDEDKDEDSAKKDMKKMEATEVLKTDANGQWSL